MSTPASDVDQPPHARRRAATRRRLIDAALDVFSRNGFHAASLDEIAASAGVSKGAVYYNFTSKEDLFLTLLEDQFERILDNVRANSEGAQSAAHLFITTIEGIPGWLPLYLEFLAYASRTPRVAEDYARRFVRDSRRQVTDTLQQFAGELDTALPAPVAELAVAVDAIMLGFTINRLFDPDAVPDRLVDEALLRTALGSIE
ncbi:TetR/AcrR family transcriptional regulator [Mycobacterium sp. PDNC021]|uniref:TetR/AcrR family transcriptional regulator n=1 Tax=Mycobacterium sp. PDNC021 TaxID=3391399 RepID=UPI003AABF367